MVPPVGWDPFDPAQREDPYPTYAALRRHDPVHRTAWGAFVVSRYADCLAALHDRHLGNDPRRGAGVQELLAAEPPSAADEHERAGFMFRDPPEHTRLRGLVARELTPARVASLRADVAGVVDASLERAAGQGGVDLVNDLGMAVPAAVTAIVMGIPASGIEKLHRWRAESVAAKRTAMTDAEGWDRRRDIRDDTLAYLAGLVDERRARRAPEGCDDVLAVLARAVDESDGSGATSMLEATLVANQLFTAGIESTAFMIGNAMAACMTRPPLWRGLVDGSMAPAAFVAEALRWDGATQVVGRVALADTTVGGIAVPAGSQVFLLLGSANRDGARFDDPDRFDPSRGDEALAFGHGRHRCVGAHLARLQVTLVVQALASRFPDLALAGPFPEHRFHPTLRGFTSLAVRLTGT